jgi:hypothetical protein
MDSRIQVGDIALDGRALVERLGQYGLLPALVQELVVESRRLKPKLPGLANATSRPPPSAQWPCGRRG